MSKTSTLLEKLVAAMERQSCSIERLADCLAPQPGGIVGTPYVAGRTGLTTVWIAEMARDGEIPTSCIVLGTGNGKPWKFHRSEIDRWIENR